MLLIVINGLKQEENVRSLFPTLNLVKRLDDVRIFRNDAFDTASITPEQVLYLHSEYVDDALSHRYNRVAMKKVDYDLY